MSDADILGAALDTGADDHVVPFAIEALEVRGRIVRLGPALDRILTRHAYPEPVAALLAEAVTLTSLLGTSLKFEGRFILQTQGDGPVGMMVVDFETPGRLRGYASFDAEAVAGLGPGRHGAGALLGSGHLAMTIDPGPARNRYQGIVPLDGGSLAAAADHYFRQSEQIPTRVRLAAAQIYEGGATGAHWRGGGLLIQHLPAAGPRRAPDLPPGDAPAGLVLAEPEMPDEWNEAVLLFGTVEDHELTDPAIAPGRLLYRLFHERGVRVFEAQGLAERCRCSRGRVAGMIAGFTAEERADMVENGEIVVTCEFCSTRYHLDPAEFD